MAATDTTDATTQSPDDIFAQAQAIADRMRGQQQSYAPPAPVNRSIISLLGEAVGGGASDVAPADREAAGTRALLNFGANLSAASGPSVMPRNFGQILAQGVGGAEQSLGSSAAVSASRLAAQQAYEEKQQELQLERIKEAIPLLQLQANQRALAGMKPPGTSVATAPGTSISGVGAPIVPRDPNVATAGEQANNPGNIMMAPGATVAGASGAIPVSGGRYVAAFPDVPTGVAAHSDLLTNYAQSGVGTIRDAVTRWVGDPKADLTSYVADVAKAAGVGPDDKVDLSDPKIQRAILLAQQPHESGKAWLSPADVDKGLVLAAARRAAPPAATGGTQAPAPYKVASTGTTAPPDSTTPPAPAQPAPDPNTFVYHPAPIPEDFKALVSGNLTPAQIQNLEAAKAGALQNFKLAQATGDPKSAAAAQDAYNKVLADETTMLGGQTDKARDFLKEFYKNDFDQQKTLFDTNHKAMLDRATKSEELQQTADINLGQDDLKARTADAGEARKVMMLLTQMGPQLENLPNGVVGTLVDKYPELVPLLQAGGINPQQATNIQLLQSARAYLSLLQKPPASGSLRTAEMSNLASYTPATLNTPQARQEMLARLLATNQRIIDERNFASNYFGRTDPATGKPIYNVRGLDEKIDAPLKLDANGNRTADSGLGPVVPEPPPQNAPAAAHQAYQKYVAQLRNNFPYWTYRQRTDQTTRLPVADKNGAPVFDRVLRIKGVNDMGPGG